MKSSPSSGIGGQFGITANIYQRDNYKLAFELGYRYMRVDLTSTETKTDPLTIGGTQYLLSQNDPTATVSNIYIEAETTVLSTPYFSLNLLF